MLEKSSARRRETCHKLEVPEGTEIVLHFQIRAMSSREDLVRSRADR